MQGIAALKMGGKTFLNQGRLVVNKKEVPIIKTDPVPGKPEWFDQLVTKVIN